MTHGNSRFDKAGLEIEFHGTITFRSILSDVEKHNLEMKKLLAKTEARINRTKNHIDYLKRLKVWTVNNLHEMES